MGDSSLPALRMLSLSGVCLQMQKAPFSETHENHWGSDSLYEKFINQCASNISGWSVKDVPVRVQKGLRKLFFLLN